MVRTGLPGRLEHFVAYAGSAAIAIAGYGLSRGSIQIIIGGFWMYAAILEYLQHFSPGRHPAVEDFAASAVGALCGALASCYRPHLAAPIRVVGCRPCLWKIRLGAMAERGCLAPHGSISGNGLSIRSPSRFRC
jgi:hypothetical protein